MRRLPVIQESTKDPVRTPGRLLALGIGLVFTLWLPLAMLALPAGPRLAQSLLDLPRDLRVSEVVVRMTPGDRVVFVVAQAGPSLAAFTLAAAAGGAILQRLGATTRVGALAGLGAALLAWAVALLGGALSPWFVALSAATLLGSLGAGFGAVGARIASFFSGGRVASPDRPPE